MAACYTLSKKKKKELNNLIRGAFGNTWGHNFYMGTQNGSKLEFDGRDHTLQLSRF